MEQYFEDETEDDVEVKMDKLYVLNTPILTAYGNWSFKQLTLYETRVILYDAVNIVSAVGHEATAKFMTKLFGMFIPMNRVAIHMNHGEKAIVFKLIDRLPEGKILSFKEMENVKYEIGLLRRE